MFLQPLDPLLLSHHHHCLHGGAGQRQPWKRADKSVTRPSSVLLEEAARPLVLLCLTFQPSLDFAHLIL